LHGHCGGDEKTYDHAEPTKGELLHGCMNYYMYKAITEMCKT